MLRLKIVAKFQYYCQQKYAILCAMPHVNPITWRTTDNISQSKGNTMTKFKKFGASVSAIALAGALTVAAPNAVAADNGDQTGSSASGKQDGSSNADGKEGNGSSDEELAKKFPTLSSKDGQKPDSSSTEEQALLGVGITAGILALGAALWPQIQQFLPKM